MGQRQRVRADYGLDAPGLVKFFMYAGTILGAGGIFLEGGALMIGHHSFLIHVIGNTMTATGCVFILEMWGMMFSSHYGKLRARDRLIDGLELKGDEQVLDVGCGRGLLLIGAAKRLKSGKAVGLDLWSQTDLGDNRKSATMENAAIEAVTERVEVADGDMRKMPFADGTFDAVVASNSIHNIYDREGRREAIGEIVRVLKPGGRVGLLDIRHTAQYAEDLRAMGMKGVERSGLVFWIFPPVRVVRGKK